MLQQLPSDLLAHFLEYLCFVDRWAVVVACPPLLKLKNQGYDCINVKKIIDQALLSQKLFSNFEAFLSRYNLVVSGLWLCLHLFGLFEKTDKICIYVCGEYKYPDPFLKMIMSSWPAQEAKKHHDDCFDPISEVEKAEKQHAGKVVFTVQNVILIMPNMKEIQYSTCRFLAKDATLQDAIVDRDPIDFNRISYDGNKLRVYNWNVLFNRECSVDMQSFIDIGLLYNCTAQERIYNLLKLQQKYQKLGLNLNILNWQQCILNYCTFPAAT